MVENRAVCKGCNPKVSVIMSVYNGEKYLREAVDSILRQTYKDFEFLITDDNSCDKTAEILSSYDDSRLKVFYNKTNKGLTKNLNYLISNAKGDYIARMDADDISYPSRLEKEVGALEADDSVYMVCTYTNVFGDKSSVTKTPADYEILRAQLLFGNPITHSSVMFRKNDQYLYDECYFKSQDYELWDRIVSRGGRIKVIQEPLVAYRVHDDQITKKGIQEQEELTETVLIRALERLKIFLSPDEKRVYVSGIRKKAITGEEATRVFFKVLTNIKNANKSLRIYSLGALSIAMREYYRIVIKHCLKPFRFKLSVIMVKAMIYYYGSFLAIR